MAWTLDFTLDGMGKHWKVLNTELTSSDLHLTGSF